MILSIRGDGGEGAWHVVTVITGVTVVSGVGTRWAQELVSLVSGAGHG